jgi:DNA-binding MurR/RpiR family transcriptional regulator
VIAGFYFDEDSAPRAVLAALAGLGLVCVSAVSVGNQGLTDEEQLAEAAARGLALVTSNRGDFGRLHGQWMRAGRDHAGIVILTEQRFAPGTMIAKLALLATTRESDMMRNAILFISPRVVAS